MRSGAVHSSGRRVSTLIPAHRELDHAVPKGLLAREALFLVGPSELQQALEYALGQGWVESNLQGILMLRGGPEKKGRPGRGRNLSPIYSLSLAILRVC